MRTVRPEIVDGLRCPRCGRPVRWICKVSADGRSVVRKTPWTSTSKTRYSKRDRQVTGVTQSGAYEMETTRLWRHVTDIQCVKCNWAGDESQAEHRPAPTDEELRELRCYASYWIEDDE